MPDSQQAMHDNNPTYKAAYRAWASQVSTGVHQILSGRRGNVMPQKPKLDLCACLNLLDGDDPLPFAWDTSLYTNPPPLSAPRLATARVGSQQGDRRILGLIPTRTTMMTILTQLQDHSGVQERCAL